MESNKEVRTFLSSSDQMDTGQRMRPAVARAAAVCPVEIAISIVGGAWKMTAVKYLRQRPHRFGELQRAIGTVTARVLTRQLRELEADGIIDRTVYAEVPPRVVYSLTELGESLGVLVDDLDAWGQQYAQCRPR
jgi:DNA-binding HxlR family transcriptional regulator